MTSQTRAPSSYPTLTTPEEPPIFSSSRSARAERSWAGAAGGGRACTHSRMAAGMEARTGMAGVTHWAPGTSVYLGGSQGPLTAPGAPGDPCPSWGSLPFLGTSRDTPHNASGQLPLGAEIFQGCGSQGGGTLSPRKGWLGGTLSPQERAA